MGWLEILDHDLPVEDRCSGEFVCTSLLDADMPLIRYRLGDRGARRASIELCRCGRGLPLLDHVEGRADDVLYTADGRSIGRLDPVFKANLPIREAQVVQVALDHVRVLYVPADGYAAKHGEVIRQALHARLGPIRVTLEATDKVPRGANGKFRAVICEIPREERPRSTHRQHEHDLSVSA